MTRDGLTKRDVAITGVEVFARPDPRDPLTKAGGLAPTQDIRKAK